LTYQEHAPMTAQLRLDPFLKRNMRGENWEGQQRSSFMEAADAIRRDENRAAAAEMVEVYLWEMQWLYGGYLAWVKDWIVEIGRRDPQRCWDYLVRAHRHLRYLNVDTLPVEVADAVCSLESNHGIGLENGPEGSVLRNRERLSIPLSAWLDVGSATLARLRQQIASGEAAAALTSLEQLHAEHKPVHDAYCDWLWLWMTLLAHDWGEEQMIDLIASSGDRLRTAGLKALPSIPVADQVRHMVAAMRGHRSGPGELGDVRIVEDEEKFTVSFDACGSGGRMRRRGEIDGLPARQDAPFHFGVTQKAHPMSWGKTGVPYYCLHCAAYAEMQSTDLIGYPSRVTLFDPDGGKPCAWSFYKRPEDIPEHFFDRIGKTRDPSRFARAAPVQNQDPNSKS
jgi:hypothetical protein